MSTTFETPAEQPPTMEAPIEQPKTAAEPPGAAPPARRLRFAKLPAMTQSRRRRAYVAGSLAWSAAFTLAAVMAARRRRARSKASAAVPVPHGTFDWRLTFASGNSITFQPRLTPIFISRQPGPGPRLLAAGFRRFGRRRR